MPFVVILNEVKGTIPSMASFASLRMTKRGEPLVKTLPHLPRPTRLLTTRR